MDKGKKILYEQLNESGAVFGLKLNFEDPDSASYSDYCRLERKLAKLCITYCIKHGWILMCLEYIVLYIILLLETPLAYMSDKMDQK